MQLERIFCTLVATLFFSVCADQLVLQPQLHTYDPLLVVTIMVKDEEPVICQTLQPYVDAGINSFLVFDTGSTDNTIEVVRDFFEQHGVANGYIEQEPFIDFATSRNRAIELTELHFPQAAFLLMPDAEWYLHDVEGLLEFCATDGLQFHRPCYLVRIVGGNIDFYTPRLIRCHTFTRFEGVVHEVPNRAADIKVPGQVYFNLQQTLYGQEKTRKRWERDLDLLLNAHYENPEDARTLFYLAQTCECLGDLKAAEEWYIKRFESPGFVEENFMAAYRCAQVKERLAEQGEREWSDALEWYLKAYSIRPTRVEPLIKLSQYYLAEDNFYLASLFAKAACEAPYPDDILFVEKDAYDFTRFDVLGIASWYVGEFDIGEQAVQQALKVHPDMPHLHRNLALYLERRDT